MPKDLIDTLYPNGQKWYTVEDGIRGYFTPGWDEAQADLVAEGSVWKLVCNVTYGGCGAEIAGHSREEAIAAWNRRAHPPTAPSANTAHSIVSEQAIDDGLWFDAQTAPEAYLQQELRRLHAAVESFSPPAAPAAQGDARDAARYRHIVATAGEEGVMNDCYSLPLGEPDKDEWDRTIDAAMKERSNG